MSDITELKDEIAFINTHLKEGGHWDSKANPAQNLHKLIYCLASLFLQARQNICKSEDELNIFRINESIADWERLVGLPNDIFAQIPIELADRILNIIIQLVGVRVYTYDEFINFIKIVFNIENIEVINGASFDFDYDLNFTFIDSDLAKNTVIIKFPDLESTSFDFFFNFTFSAEINVLEEFIRSIAPFRKNIIFQYKEPIITLANPNYVANSIFSLWQRGESFTDHPNDEYTADAWTTTLSADVDNVSLAQDTIDGQSVNVLYYNNIGLNGGIRHKIENILLFLNQTIATSFYVKTDDTSTDRYTMRITGKLNQNLSEDFITDYIVQVSQIEPVEEPENINDVIILDQTNTAEIISFGAQFSGANNSQLVFQIEGEDGGEITNFDGASVSVSRLLDDSETPPASNWHPLLSDGSQVVFNALDQNYKASDVMSPVSFRFDLSGATGSTKVVIRYRFKYDVITYPIIDNTWRKISFTHAITQDDFNDDISLADTTGYLAIQFLKINDSGAALVNFYLTQVKLEISDEVTGFLVREFDYELMRRNLIVQLFNENTQIGTVQPVNATTFTIRIDFDYKMRTAFPYASSNGASIFYVVVDSQTINVVSYTIDVDDYGYDMVLILDSPATQIDGVLYLKAFEWLQFGDDYNIAITRFLTATDGRFLTATDGRFLTT